MRSLASLKVGREHPAFCRKMYLIRRVQTYTCYRIFDPSDERGLIIGGFADNSNFIKVLL